MFGVLFACVFAFAATNEFRGVNWADPRDNFVSDKLVLTGMSKSDTYESASVVADKVIGQFQELLGTNSVRIPVNEATILDWWDTYTGIIDMGLTKGRMILCYWGPAHGAGPANMDRFWNMWKKIVDAYADEPNAYFEIFNEPNMYNKDQLRNLYATWLEKFPNVPRNHIILDGTGMAQNVPEIGDDSRFDECLLAVHDYSMWGFFKSEEEWMGHISGEVGKYADRTICTEWGGAMSPGTKNGEYFDYQDYNKPTSNYFMAYIRGVTEQLRKWEMGSFYWVGLKEGDWYSMTKKSGEGANIKLEIVNQSGVDRMQYSWTDTVETAPAKQDPFGGKAWAIPGVIQAEDYDEGGSRVSFYDKSSENEGGAYREDAVDIVALDSTDASKGYAIGYTEAGEWLEYTVDVTKTGTYSVAVVMATASERAGVQLSIDGKVVTDSLIAEQGEDWSAYVATQAELGELAEGEHVLKMLVVGNYVNIDWLRICEGTTCDASVDSVANPDSLKVVADSSLSPADSGVTFISNVFALAPVAVNVTQRVEVFSVAGRFLGRFDVARGNVTETLKVAGLPKGIYFVRSKRLGKMYGVKISE